MKPFFSEGRLLGHPVHVMLVHFPAGLLPSAFLFDLGGVWTGDPGLHQAAFWCMAAGVASGLPAAAFGFWDFVRLEDPVRMQTALWHGAMEFSVLLLFALLTGLRWQQWPAPGVPGTWELVAAGLGLLLMAAANFRGGELVHGPGG